MKVPGRPLRLLASALFLAGAARAGVVETVPALNVPLAPTPVVLQLQLDLAALNPGLTIPVLAPSTLLPILQAAAQAKPVVAAPVATPLAASAVKPAGGALERVQVAQKLLGRWSPGEFAKLPEAGRDAALAELWDGWKARGLVQEPEPASPVDKLILDGVGDKELTSANKSIFLGVAVLGYPLQDALWLSRTRINDALDENALRYPRGQKWHTADHTPEFLGVSPQAQGYVDAWGAATDYGTQIAAAVRAGSKNIPKSAAAPREAAVAFARVVDELLKAGDHEAVDYLTGPDPTFTAFLLDARKPGYYLYDGKGSIVERILKTKAAGAMGIRRVEHAHDGIRNYASVYYYRPRRVLERLREAKTEPTGDYGVKERDLLAGYIPRLEPLVAPAKKR